MAHLKAKGGRLQALAALFAAGAALFALSAVAQNAERAAPAREGVLLSLTGPVTPANAQYLAREIAAASQAKKELVLIEIDTPGGLMDSMKTIIQAILASETPVATFVYPQGARSASAGLYIMYAAHVSAMAPSTNTGAATPVEIGGPPRDDGERRNPFERQRDEAPQDDSAEENAGETAADKPDAARPQRRSPLGNDDAMRAKIINDSVAYIRSLAEERGRNADWAETAVREAASVGAREALALGVIDIVAADIDDLLAQMDGRVVVTAAGERALATKDLPLIRVEPRWIEKILGFIANPNVAVILMSLATTGIIIEMWNPGSIFPGAMGLVCLVLGLYSFQVLPFSWLGAALMMAGVVFMAVEAYTPTFGLIGVVGFLLFGFGLFALFPAGFAVSPAVIVSILAITGSLLAFILIAVIGSRSHGPLIGAEAIRRREGIVDDWDGREGHVIVEGERWRARSDRPLKKGDRIRVVEVDGLVLVVKQAKASGLLGALAPNEA